MRNVKDIICDKILAGAYQMETHEERAEYIEAHLDRLTRAEFLRYISEAIEDRFNLKNNIGL
jgi:AraC-like DNA-binding protein